MNKKQIETFVKCTSLYKDEFLDLYNNRFDSEHKELLISVYELCNEWFDYENCNAIEDKYEMCEQFDCKYFVFKFKKHIDNVQQVKYRDFDFMLERQLYEDENLSDLGYIQNPEPIHEFYSLLIDDTIEFINNSKYAI